MRIAIPQIPIHKEGVNMANPDFLMLLRPSKIYGRLNLKFWDYHERHIYMNHLLTSIYMDYSLTKRFIDNSSKYSRAMEHHKILFNTESFVYWTRKNIDEIIGLLYYVDHLCDKHSEPQKLSISTIGMLLKKKNHRIHQTLSAQIDKLEVINNISNTFKHSFITSEVHYLIGKNEPTLNCLDMDWNSFDSEPKLHEYYLREIVDYYVDFFITARCSLKEQLKTAYRD